MCQGRDSLRYIPRCGLLEIKKDRYVVQLPQFFPDRVQDRFSRRLEAAQDENSLLADGVDYLSDSFVPQQKVNELRHLDVVDGNLGAVFIFLLLSNERI